MSLKQRHSFSDVPASDIFGKRIHGYKQGVVVPGTWVGLLRHKSNRQIAGPGGPAPGTVKKLQPRAFSHPEPFPARTRREIRNMWCLQGASPAPRQVSGWSELFEDNSREKGPFLVKAAHIFFSYFHVISSEDFIWIAQQLTTSP